MIQVSFESFMLAFVLCGLGIIFGLWLFYDRRDRSLYDEQRLRHTFHCVKCGALYSEGGNRQLAKCPSCGFTNDRLRF